MTHITLIANSINIMYPIRFGRAPFSVHSIEAQEIINNLEPCSAWLYYPNDLAWALFERGIDCTIHCHSGEILESHNGVMSYAT